MSGQIFLKTLKRLEYPEADLLDDSDFEWMFSVKELLPFLDIFCSLGECNVLTTEEIEAYFALTPAELAEIEILEKSGYVEKSCIQNEERREVCFLQEHLMCIENQNKYLEKQVELFKKHEEELLEEKEIRQKLLLDVKKKFQMYEMSLIPHREDEFISDLKFISDVIQDLESLIMNADEKGNTIPSSSFFKDIVRQYLTAEEKILQYVRVFLHSNFQLTEEDQKLLFINSEISQNEELKKEVAYLQKMLKQNMMDKIVSELEVTKIENIMNNFEAAENSPDFNCHPSQLRYKFDDAVKLNEKLKKKEQELKEYMSNVVAKHIDAQCTKLALYATKSTSSHISYVAEKLMLPLEILLHQRARVETLITSLHKHTADLQNLKILIEIACNQVKEEKLHLEKRKIQVGNKVNKDISKQSERNPEGSIFLSLYKILKIWDESDIQDLSNVSLKDILQKASKLKAKDNFERKHEENMKIIEMIEKHSVAIESLLNCVDKEYSNWHEQEQSLNANLNSLVVKLAPLEASISECRQDLEQKQKLLERKGNLRLARNLYVYALTNKDLFKKCIDDVKETIKNSADYKA